MSKITKTLALAAVLFASFGGHPKSAAALSVPATITQQGRILASDGTPVDGSQLTFTFSLYTTATGGDNVWTETQTITPDKGYFSAQLGEGTAFPANVFNGSQPALYLGIKIGADAEMTPRQQIASVPFAMLAANAINATHADAATTASKADVASNAATVTSIASNFSYKNGNGSSVSCDTGQFLVAGFCLSGGSPITDSTISAGSPKTYSCQCSGTASCSTNAVATCAK